MTSSRPTPKFVGIDTFRDHLGRFTVRYPSDWHLFDIDFGRDGKLFAPSATNTNTYVAVWVDKLDFTADGSDAPALAKAFNQGLNQLGDCTIIEQDDAVISNLIKLERFYTFNDNGVIRKRKVWAMYVAQWLIVLTFQGETVEEWEHWYAMANQSFHHFVIPPELFFAMDKDLMQKGTKAEKVKRGKKS
ncbi:MAG: hypothetical protein ACKO83_08440 [Roseiflexaceae bacterium]